MLEVTTAILEFSMVLDSNAAPILERYKVAKAAESLAIANLHAALDAGLRDKDALRALTQQMEDTNIRCMAIYAELNAIRLDK